MPELRCARSGLLLGVRFTEPTTTNTRGGPDVFPGRIVDSNTRVRKNVWVTKSQEDGRRTADNVLNAAHIELTSLSRVKNDRVSRPRFRTSRRWNYHYHSIWASRAFFPVLLN